MIASIVFTMSTIYTLHKVQYSGKWSCHKWFVHPNDDGNESNQYLFPFSLQLSRLVIGCGVAVTFLFGLCSLLLASGVSGKSRKKNFWGYRKNICARILNGFVSDEIDLVIHFNYSFNFVYIIMISYS